MNAREMKNKLVEFPYLANRINDIVEEIKQIRSDEEDLRDYKSSNITGMPKATSNDDNMALKVSKIIDIYEKRINDYLIPELERKQSDLAAMEKIIYQLTGNEYLVIKAKYIEKRSWEEVARELHYSRSYVVLMGKQAIDSLVKLWIQYYN